MNENRRFERITSVILSMALVCSLSLPVLAADKTTTSDGVFASSVAQQDAAVTGVKLNITQKTIRKGKTVTLKATVSPMEAANKNVTWISSNKKIATVSSKGVVKGVKNGKVTIICKTADGTYKATAKITVGTPVSKVKLNAKKQNHCYRLQLYPESYRKPFQGQQQGHYLDKQQHRSCYRKL